MTFDEYDEIFYFALKILCHSLREIDFDPVYFLDDQPTQRKLSEDEEEMIF
jgi:hypothetical protein